LNISYGGILAFFEKLFPEKRGKNQRYDGAFDHNYQRNRKRVQAGPQNNTVHPPQRGGNNNKYWCK